MRRPIKIALIAAAPVALLNTPPTFAIDVGLPDNASPFARFMAAEWVVMHWLGVWLIHFDPYYKHFALDISLVCLSGYIEWAVLLIAGFYAFLGVRHLAQRFSAMRA